MSDWLGIPSNEVLNIWSAVEPSIQAALDQEDTGYNAEDILTRIQTRDMQLWVHPVAVAVTEIHQLPRFKKLVLVTLGGSDMDAWIEDLMEVLGNYAKGINCKYLEQWGRKGWLRVNEKYQLGGKPTFQVMRIEL